MVSELLTKKILVTGATGFIGANLTHYLVSQGCRPHITLRKESNTWRINEILKKLHIHYVDLSDKDRIKKIILMIKPRIIYHCATYGGFSFQADSDKIINTNIIGTINLVNACRKIEFDCLVNTGSSSEYGLKKQPMKESDLLEPINDYGISKATATLFCQSVAMREKLPIATLRLFSPYGYFESQARLIPSVILSCLNKTNPELSCPDSVRDFIFIDDVINAYTNVLENNNKIRGEIFNIGYGRQYSVGEVVNKIIDLISDKIKPQWESISNLRVEPTSWIADISKAKEILKWMPCNNLDAGLIKTIDWLKRNLKLYNEKN